jgi:hypothetical protein
VAREFIVIDEVSIKFGENVIQWNATYNEIFRTRHGRSLVQFNQINERVLNLLCEYCPTDEERKIIHNALWSYLFQVKR